MVGHRPLFGTWALALTHAKCLVREQLDPTARYVLRRIPSRLKRKRLPHSQLSKPIGSVVPATWATQSMNRRDFTSTRLRCCRLMAGCSGETRPPNVWCASPISCARFEIGCYGIPWSAHRT